jgi:hypothetical protein
MHINTEFGHSARFLFSFKAVCAVENGPPRLPRVPFICVELHLCGSAAHSYSSILAVKE